MLPSLKEYCNHSVKYKDSIEELKAQWNSVETREAKKKLLDEFSDNYLMPSKLWVARLKDVDYQEYEILYQLENKSTKHFCHDWKLKKFTDETMIIYRNTKPIEMPEPYWEETFKYPQRSLRFLFMKYEETLDAPLPKSVYENLDKMEKVFWEIKSSENDIEKWIECFKKVGHQKFVKTNIEHRLSMQLTNKDLWKLYIEYLRENDPKEMLQVYSKYCRFFLDDFEMKNEYKNATEKYGPVLVSWKNPFEFETVGDYVAEEHEDPPNFNDRQPSDFLIDYPPFLSNRQKWPLPLPILRYITNSANPNILRKLQRTCKSFFVQRPEILCYKFAYYDSLTYYLRFFKEAIECSLNVFPRLPIKKLHITNSFTFFHGKRNILSNFIKNSFYRCSVKYIQIYGQTISENEFKFLVGHGNVESLEMREMEIIKEGEQLENMGPVEILKLLPNIRCFYAEQCLLSDIETSRFSDIKLNNKLLRFVLESVNQKYDSDDFCEFLNKNAAPFSYFQIYFIDDSVSRDDVKALKKDVKNCLKKWDFFDGKSKVVLTARSA